MFLVEAELELSLMPEPVLKSSLFLELTLLISSIDPHGYLHSADPKVHNENLLNSAQFLGPSIWVQDRIDTGPRDWSLTRRSGEMNS